MMFYMAPMEGLTGFTYRNAWAKFYKGIDKYFTPFIPATVSRRFNTRELRDVIKEHNTLGLNVIPQILSNNAEAFNSTANRLLELGYKEININLGCPSKTVVKSGRGAGFLSDREKLVKFLDEVFKNTVPEISVKTRIGMHSEDEFKELLHIYNSYPIKELIIHPRTGVQMYSGKPSLTAFDQAVERAKIPLCYNGDIFTRDDFEIITERYKDLNAVMLGRGIIARPYIIENIKYGKKEDKSILKSFHDEYFNINRELFGNDAIFRMKEMWTYFKVNFPNSDKQIKNILKSKKISEYICNTDKIFQNF